MLARIVVVQEHEGRRVVCRAGGIDAIAVRKIEQAPQVPESVVMAQLLHILEHRTEISASEAVQRHGLHVSVKLLLGGDLRVLLDRGVALDDVEIDLGEKAFRAGGL